MVTGYPSTPDIKKFNWRDGGIRDLGDLTLIRMRQKEFLNSHTHDVLINCEVIILLTFINIPQYLDLYQWLCKKIS